MVTHFWSTAVEEFQGGVDSGVTTYRYYIDGEAEASVVFTPREAACALAPVGVVALSASADGDTRVDYVFRVVPTDLDLDPRGACPLFGAGQLDPCSEEEGFPFFADNCWPILSLP